MSVKHPSLYLICVQGEYRGSSWVLDENGLSIGRGQGSSIVLKDSLVSRRQCRLSVVDGNVKMEDLGAKNPCLVNGMPTRAATLRPGDELAIVHERFIIGLSHPGKAPADQKKADERTESWVAGRMPARGELAGQKTAIVRARTIEELAIIHDLALELSDCTTRPELVSLFLNRLRALVEADRVWLGVYDERGDHALIAALDWPEAAQDPFAHHVAEDMRSKPMPFLGSRAPAQDNEQGGSSAIAVPVIAMSHLVATLIAEREGRERPCGNSDLHQAALAAQTLAPFLKMATELQTLRHSYSLLTAKSGKSGGLLGDSAVMQRLRERLLAAGRSGLSVLLVGETGTGKELAAKLIHQVSSRSEAPFVTVNCAAIPESLLESELFGYVRGAFTGAVSAREGLFAEAHQGTLFLDEVGDLSGRNQARILRAIDTGTFRPVGDSKDRQVDVRIVAATNINLHDAIAAGAFRGDLFHRLCGVEINMPPLRGHPEDIPLLLHHFIHQAARELGLAESSEIATVYDRAMRHAWPGNVRELRNAAYRALVESTARDIPFSEAFAPDRLAVADPRSVPKTLAESERDAILQALDYFERSVAKAAECLGVSRSSLYAKIRDYGIER